MGGAVLVVSSRRDSETIAFSPQTPRKQIHMKLVASTTMDGVMWLWTLTGEWMKARPGGGGLMAWKSQAFGRAWKRRAYVKATY